MKWFRVYTDILDDTKIGDMTDIQFRCFILMMTLASTYNRLSNDLGETYDGDRNTYKQGGFLPLSEEQISWRLRIDVRAVKNAITKMIERNILVKENNGFRFINWNKRQFISDNINERVKRYRDKKCNVTVTADVTPSDTDTDTDTDTEKKSKKEIRYPNWLPIEIFNDFKEMRKQKKKPLTGKAEVLVITELEKLKEAGNDPKAVLEQSIMNSWQGLFEIKNKGGNNGTHRQDNKLSPAKGKYDGIGTTIEV